MADRRLYHTHKHRDGIVICSPEWTDTLTASKTDGRGTTTCSQIIAGSLMVDGKADWTRRVLAFEHDIHHCIMTLEQYIAFCKSELRYAEAQSRPWQEAFDARVSRRNQLRAYRDALERGRTQTRKAR